MAFPLPGLSLLYDQLFIINLVFLVLAWLVLALRVYVRIVRLKHWGRDDWVMVVAVLLWTACGILEVVGIHSAARIADNPDFLSDFASIEAALQIYFVYEVLYGPSSMAIKCAVGLFFLSIACAKSQRRFLWSIIVLNLAVGTAMSLFFIFQCRPVQYFWTQYDFYGGIQGGSCVDLDKIAAIYYFQGTVSAASDWALALFPAWMLWDVQMGRRTKILIGSLMAMGSLGGVATVIRMTYINTIVSIIGPVGLSKDIALWTNVEFGIAILAPSLVSLQPLFRVASKCIAGYFRPHTSNSSSVTLARSSGGGDGTAPVSIERNRGNDTNNNISGHDIERQQRKESSYSRQQRENEEDLLRAEKRTSVSITIRHKTRADLLDLRSKERGERWEEMGYGAVGLDDKEIGVETTCWAGDGDNDHRV